MRVWKVPCQIEHLPDFYVEETSEDMYPVHVTGTPVQCKSIVYGVEHNSARGRYSCDNEVYSTREDAQKVADKYNEQYQKEPLERDWRATVKVIPVL